MNIYLNPDQTKIGIEFPYDSLTVARVRAIPGTRWLPTRKMWVAPKDMPTYEALRLNFPVATWDGRIHDWAKEFNNQAATNGLMKDGAHSLSEAGWSFKTKPYDHQKRGLTLVENNPAFALCMEMGTGKTKVIIDLLSNLKRRQGNIKVLVVCPLSVVGNWQRECAIHADNLTASLVVGDRYERANALLAKTDVYVINYAGMRTMVDVLSKMDWDVMICDESHNIKNRTAQQSKACYMVGKKAQRRYILTGTLVTNKPLDVFGQFKFLDEAILGQNYFAFQSRYAIMATRGKAQFPVAFRNVEELSNRLAPWSYRVLKSECLDLPEKVYETRYSELNPEAAAIYKSLGSELVAELRGGDIVVASIILTKLLRFSQITAGFVTTASGEIREVGDRGKIKVLLELLDEAQGKAVVWVRFRKEMEMVREVLRDKGIGHVSLSGEDSQADRQEAIERFDRDDGVKVFVGQIEAGGTGINLTAASLCVYMTNSYSLGTRLQSEDRLHRINQKQNVTYVDIVCPGTIDEHVIKLLRAKKSVADQINQDHRAVLEMIGDVA